MIGGIVLKKYEYKSVNIQINTTVMGRVKDFEEIDAELNKLGVEGWELVNFTMGDPWSSNYKSVFVILKRIIE